MKYLTKKSWKIAIFFLLFELLFWLSGADCVNAVRSSIALGKPLVAPLEETAIFHSWAGLMISFVSLLASVVCMQQFVKGLLDEIWGH